MILGLKEQAGAQWGWDCGEGSRRGSRKGAGPDSVVLLGHGEDGALALNEVTATRGFGAGKRHHLIKKMTPAPGLRRLRKTRVEPGDQVRGYCRIPGKRRW